MRTRPFAWAQLKARSACDICIRRVVLWQLGRLCLTIRRTAQRLLHQHITEPVYESTHKTSLSLSFHSTRAPTLVQCLLLCTVLLLLLCSTSVKPNSIHSIPDSNLASPSPVPSVMTDGAEPRVRYVTYSQCVYGWMMMNANSISDEWKSRNDNCEWMSGCTRTLPQMRITTVALVQTIRQTDSIYIQCLTAWLRS